MTERVPRIEEKIFPPAAAGGVPGNPCDAGYRTPEPGAHGRRLRVLSYNIQAGISSGRYRDYVTHGWKHLFPFPKRGDNLNSIADGLGAFDLVGLQEADSGSVRTDFVNQTKYLAERSNFPFWYHQTNRRIGKYAHPSNGLLSRFRPRALHHHKLPGLPGRGVLVARFGSQQNSLVLCVMHLALGRRGRMRQLDYIANLISGFPHVVVMGDLNCERLSPEIESLVHRAGLTNPTAELTTFPSWRPRRHLDHILTSPSIRTERSYVPNWLYSDHLPIATDIIIPSSVIL